MPLATAKKPEARLSSVAECNTRDAARSGAPFCRLQSACQRQRVSLSTKLTLALALTAFLLVGGVGWWQVAAEERDLETAVEHDVRLLGRSLQVSFENALRDRQAEDVQETLGGLEAIDPEVDVLVYNANGARLAASHGARESARWLAARPERTELRFVRAPAPGHVELLVPLRITRDDRPATLVLVRPLDEMQSDLTATRVRVGWSVFAFVSVVALLTHLLARYWVSTPLALMVAHMRRVRAGDLASTPLGARDDEVGATLKEFEALVVELREARERIERDAESRAQLDHQLRDLHKMRAVGTLAAGIAHEIGSPLQVLEGRLASLEQRAEDPNEVRRVASILLDQVRRITRIVSGFLDVARRRSSASNLSVEVEKPVRAVLALLESEARRRRVEITLRAAPTSAGARRWRCPSADRTEPRAERGGGLRAEGPCRDRDRAIVDGDGRRAGRCRPSASVRHRTRDDSGNP
jgi:signal transduction histidine kinase